MSDKFEKLLQGNVSRLEREKRIEDEKLEAHKIDWKNKENVLKQIKEKLEEELKPYTTHYEITLNDYSESEFSDRNPKIEVWLFKSKFSGNDSEYFEYIVFLLLLYIFSNLFFNKSTFFLYIFKLEYFEIFIPLVSSFIKANPN